MSLRTAALLTGVATAIAAALLLLPGREAAPEPVRAIDLSGADAPGGEPVHEPPPIFAPRDDDDVGDEGEDDPFDDRDDSREHGSDGHEESGDERGWQAGGDDDADADDDHDVDGGDDGDGD